MSTQVLFVQGGGEDVHDRWDHVLVASLERALGRGYAVRYPRMPEEADPRQSTWSRALTDEIARLPSGSILVGHSIGAAILIQHLARHPPPRSPAGIALVAAPFLGEGGWPTEEAASADLGQRLPAGVPVFLYHGDADEIVPVDHVWLYARALPQATVRVLAHRDHQLGGDLSEVARDLQALAPRG